MLYDFHTHTFLSDGELSPIELIRRAIVAGYQAIALTDHVGLGHLERVIQELTRDCLLAREHWGFPALPGVELTHVPASAIAEAAHQAKELGAQLVVVHGETIVEPVEPGTNLAAINAQEVDILAHPGLLTLEEAHLAAERGLFLEVSARRGHSLSNGRVVALARQTGAKLLLNSDAHSGRDLLSPAFAQAVALGAGLTPEELEEILTQAPQKLLASLEQLGA